MYVLLHIRILRVFSGLSLLCLIRNLILKLNYNSKSVATKYQTIGTLSSRPVNFASFTCAGKRTMSTKPSSKLVPVRIYINPDKDKELIVNENKGRTGIYRWVHIESGKSYIGSSVKLNIRFKQYFNYNHISYPKRNLIIYKSLLKYGYAGFRLEILEYCSPEILLQREQFYFDMLSPEYNILKVAGSPLGYRHSEAAKKLISIASKNRKVSESTRDLKREALLGKVFDKERIENMRISNTLRKSVIVTNKETEEILEFSSMTDAGKYLGISRVSVNKYLLQNIPYKNYTISAKSSPLTNKEISEVSSSNVTKVSQQPLLLTNKETGDIKEFSSITEAAKFLDISRGRLWYFFNKSVGGGNETLKGYTISKIEDTETKLHRRTKSIEVTNIETKEVTVYSSFTLAGKALGVVPSSLSGYFAKNRTNLFRKKYILKLVEQ